MFTGLEYFDKTCSLRCHAACEGKHKASEERNKKSAEEIACALAPIFIMAEIRFLSQYTAVKIKANHVFGFVHNTNNIEKQFLNIQTSRIQKFSDSTFQL